MSELSPVSSPIRLLSLDGGGVKGLAILLILKRIMRTVQRHENLPTMPRPCDYFDLIGGTSTGGLIAIMLGRLRMTVDECIEVFQHISQIVFNNSPGILSRVYSGFIGGKPFFDAEKLEHAIKELLNARGIDEDAKLRDVDNAKCKVFVCAARAQTVHAVLLRSYQTWVPSEENYDCLIWEAARATSAAPLFFEPTTFRSTRATFVDGGLRLNNPITEVLNEANHLYPNATYKSIISIGTGWIDVRGLAVSQIRCHDVIRTCIGLSLNANNEAQKFVRERQGRDLAEKGIYHRFDVDRGLDTIKLDHWQHLDDIDAYTEGYLSRKGSELQSCAQSLCNAELI